MTLRTAGGLLQSQLGGITSGQVLYDNNGALGGISGATTDGTVLSTLNVGTAANGPIRMGTLGGGFGIIQFNTAALAATNNSIVGDGTNVFLGASAAGTIFMRCNAVTTMSVTNAGATCAIGQVRATTSTALGTTGTVSLDPTLGEIFTVTPTGAITLNAASAPVDAHVYVVVTTSGASSFNITMNTNFKSTGVLATGTVTAKVFVLHFIGDGTNLNEVSRTTAM